jgi:hypothetical protein
MCMVFVRAVESRGLTFDVCLVWCLALVLCFILSFLILGVVLYAFELYEFTVFRCLCVFS